ncbi:MAG TPA: type II toxin-antitoxin system VapC family toxin [Candidatus Aminicenantes bacterium]|nr:type II toxin-antitoxin system VapC family toxin [Candidatus Aminicenantes bacterium]
MKTKRVLDAFALLAYLGGERGHRKVKDLLSSETADLVMNDINAGEVYYSIARKRGIPSAEYFLNVILPSLPVRVLGNTFEDVIEAARLKAGHAVAFADCFAAATAVRERAPLVTGDPEFAKLGRTLEIDWLD